MSLKDLQEYQGKHGSMPDSSGTLRHGETVLTFGNIERIVAYQAPQYFAYGRP